jgi:hypothetical protein
MNVPTKTDVQSLFNHFKGDGLMVSCYADLSVAEGFQSHAGEQFKARAHEIKCLLADDPMAWDECSRNLDAVRKELTSAKAPGVRGLAVFSALQRGFFRAIPLEEPLKDELVVHTGPYLVPLLEVMFRHRCYLVVHTDSHRGRLYRATAGGIELLESIDEPVPRKQHSSGECWGMQQATIARHRDECIHHYLKELVGRIETLWGHDTYSGIVLMGEHEVIEHVRKMLPRMLGGRVVHEAAHAWTDRPNGIARDVREILVEKRQAEERRVLDTVRECREQDYAIAAGGSEVLAALQAGRIGRKGHGYLVLGPDPRETVARCTVCRSLFADMPPVCPRCRGACSDVSLWEEVLLMALRHDITVHCLPANATLSEAGGIVAVLPRDQMQA